MLAQRLLAAFVINSEAEDPAITGSAELVIVAAPSIAGGITGGASTIHPSSSASPHRRLSA